MVTGEGEARSVSSVDQAELDAAVADYQAYVLAQTEDARRRTRSRSPTRSVPVTSTRRSSCTREVRVPWEQIEPVAELFPDSDGVIDSSR